MADYKSLPRWPALLLFASLLFHAWDKLQLGLLPEMLWFCHLASFCIVVGVFLRISWLVAIGFLFHLCIGFPGYLLDVITSGETRLSSIFVHLLSLGVGFWGVKHLEYPSKTPFYTFLFFLLAQALSYVSTPASLNINLAFTPWPPLAPYFPSIWLYHLFNGICALLFLSVGHFFLIRWQKRTKKKILESKYDDNFQDLV